MKHLNSMDLKSNEGLIYSFLGWKRCSQEILSYEDCKKTGNYYINDPTECYGQARTLQQCYNNKAMKIEPLCMPIFNDLRECLFQSDSHILSCKEEINQFTFCNTNPTEYIQFLKMSTPQQKLPKVYDFHRFTAKFDYN